MKFKENYFIIFFISFFLITCLYLFFKVSFNNDLSHDYYIKYYLILATVSLFLIISLFFKRNIKKYIIIFILSSCSSLYLAETFLYFSKIEKLSVTQKRNKIHQLRDRIAKLNDIDFDLRDRKQVFNELQKKNKSSSVSISTNKLLDNKKIIPLAQKSNSLLINCNENGYWTMIYSDRFGFNNDDAIWDNKKIDILLIGDSFIYGNCVKTDESGFAHYIEKFTNKKTLNLGIPGAGLLSYYARILEYTPEFEFEKILFFITEYDLNHDFFKEKNSLLNNYLIENKSFNLKIKQNEIDNILDNIIQKNLNKLPSQILSTDYSFIDYLKLQKIRNLTIKDSFNFRRNKNKEIANLEKIFLNVRELHPNSEIYFVFLPTFNNYSKFFKRDKIPEFEFIKKILEKNNFKFIDVHHELFNFQKNPKKYFPFELWGHYNDEGYKVISKYLTKKIF
jgi:hypothetical protein